MPFLNVQVTERQKDVVREGAGDYSESDFIRKLIDFYEVMRNETILRRKTFGMFDADGNVERIIGLEMLLKQVDTHPNRIDEGGPL